MPTFSGLYQKQAQELNKKPKKQKDLDHYTVLNLNSDLYIYSWSSIQSWINANQNDLMLPSTDTQDIEVEKHVHYQ